ncbi:hypothetical protein DSO57_1008380 [Entomophthora muscae]|uniref:Uncharacterized protein n=1 Tax=Entomophthora muscae TaxID=34485 RepID=A0ACC2RY84_9FUNG|nr:hypothetical protein DSO57_1008380 [Entomophthora muscae]
MKDRHETGNEVGKMNTDKSNLQPGKAGPIIVLKAWARGRKTKSCSMEDSTRARPVKNDARPSFQPPAAYFTKALFPSW